MPAAARTIDESLVVAYNVYYAAAKLIRDRYGMRLLRADEGGMAPPCRTPEEMIETALDAIRAAGYAAGSEVALALDVAASHFRGPGGYRLGEEFLTSTEMIERIRRWVDAYPLVSVEDGLAEDDWDSWPALCAAIGDRALVVGDDLLCTNPLRIRRAIAERSCNALLLKVNQIGTLTEALAALPVGARRRLGCDHQCSQRRNGGSLGSRSGRRLVGRSVQERLHHAIGTAGKVQPATGHRRGDRISSQSLA